MPLFVQLKDKKGADVHHVVASVEDIDGGGRSSMDFKRLYHLGCGNSQEGPGHALYEAETPSWTNRHVHKGCFASATDPQKEH